MISRLFPSRIVALFLLLLLGAGSLLLDTTSQAMQEAHASLSPSPSSLSPAVPDDGTETLPPGASIQTLLGNMTNPIAMAFDPQGRLFYTEKSTGNVRLFDTATMTLQAGPVIHFDVDSCSERGLLGIAIDPSFNTNHFIYVYYTAYPGSACGDTMNRVARFVETNGVGSGSVDIFTSPQTAGNHNGGNIHFGPDGKLYISIGDNANAANAQDLSVKNGKMHRINPDGTIPPDNPVFTQTGALPSIYAFGLRNSFDFTFDPIVAGRIWASENGPSCDDEMNRIERGYNYGWRASYPCDDPSPSPTYNTINPLWFLGNGGGGSGACCQAPTGITVYTGNQVAQWHNDLFMVTYSDGVLHHFRLNGTRDGLASAANAVQGVTVNTDIETGPDGALWYIEGGGYSTGTLKRIIGPGPTFTPTWVPATATSTATASATASTPSATRTTAPTQTPGGPSATATSTVAPTGCNIHFQDVAPGSTFYSYVQCLACRGIIAGYRCGGIGEPCDPEHNLYFRPDAMITRAQLSKIVAASAGFSEPAGSQSFEDVPPNDTFYVWIQRLAFRGYINGYPCGSPGEPCMLGNRNYFRPNNRASRGQISKIVSEVRVYVEDPSGQTFQDVPPGSTFYLWVERLASRGFISGYPCGGPGEPCMPGNRKYFRPNNPASRGQVSKIVSSAFFPECQSLPAGTSGVEIREFAFRPGTVTIPAGTTIRWSNHDLDYHTTTSDDHLFDSGHLNEDQHYDFTFTTPGSYSYYCTPHPYMRGTIIVTSP